MPLESVTHVEDLNPQNPAYLDQRSEGDDHIRNIKTALKNTFPGMTGRAWRKRNAATSGNITKNDNMVLINAAAGITLIPDPAASIGNGFITMIRAPSTGNVTVNPGENINGAEQYVIPANYTAIVMSDGSEWHLMLVFNDIPPSVPAFPSGTRMVFHQTTAPTGWTKLVSSIYNDAGLRVTTGTVGSGGGTDFTAVFGTGKNTGSTVLTEAQIPAHDHIVPVTETAAGNIARTFFGSTPTQDGSSARAQGTTGGSIWPYSAPTGGGGGHTHTMALNLKYVDVIVASKD